MKSINLGLVFKSTIISAMIFTQGAFADNTQNTSEQSEFKYKEVKTYQELPELPKYSGQAEFVRGLIYPSARGGASISYTLCAKESKQTVIRWYQDVLRMYKWEMDKEQSLNGVSGRKGKAHVQIAVAPTSRQAFGSDITISYNAESK